MSIFRREPPPPPKTSSWIKIAVPITFGCIFALIGIVYNSMAGDVIEIKEHISIVEQKKVDNETLQLMLKNQEMMIIRQKEEADRKREEDAKKFEKLQETQRKTLESIQMIQMQRQPGLPAITTEVYQYYMSLTKEQKIEFRKLNPAYQQLPAP